mmetsp:Transcript_39500/g.50953  ORF Transcript_39500/g.50953 Transcript_39500/m.50953 type:complete len:277 (+) Transcript_39500:518-1348(+)
MTLDFLVFIFENEEVEDDDEEEEEEDNDDGDEQSEDDEEAKPTKSRKRASVDDGISITWQLSDGLMDLFGVEDSQMDYKVAQRLLQEYIKKLPKDPSDGRKYMNDEKLVKLFGVKRLTLFGVSKHLKKHIKKWVEGPAVESPQKKKVKAVTTKTEKSPKTANAKKKAPAKKKKDKAKGADDEEKVRKPSGFATTLYKLAPKLAKVTGEKELPRPQVVKKLWEYIKRNDLQDPKDKRTIVCDANLKNVFDGHDTVTAFTMNKYISQHLTKLDKKTEE